MFAKFAHPKKSRTRKFQTPKKSFDHPCHLKSGVPHPPWAIHCKLHLVPDIDDIFCRISIVSVPPHFNQPGHSITDKELILFELQPTLSMSRRKAREAYLIKIEAKLFHQTI